MPETKDEKQVQQQPAPSASSPSKGNAFRVVARVWVVLIGVCWAATVAFALSLVSWLGSASLHLGRIPVSAGALAAGALVGAGLIFVGLTKLGDRLTLSRPGLGRATRGSAFGGIGALAAFGAYALYMAPTIASTWWANIVPPLLVMGKTLALKPILFPALGAFLTAMMAVFLILNQEKFTDFLIETEGEVKKVSWPARKEYLGSAMVVVLVVAVVSGFLHFVDMGLSQLMEKLGIGF